MTTFYIRFSPQRRDDRLNVEKRGATLLLNGEVFDPGTYEASSHPDWWVVGQPEILENGWSITIILPHGSPAPRETRFPQSIEVSADGPVELPPYDGPDEDQERLILEIGAKLLARQNYETTTDGREIKIPKRLTLGEMPSGVYFNETSYPFERFQAYGAIVANLIGIASLIDLEILRTAVSQHGNQSLLANRTAFAALRSDDQRRRYIRSVAENTGRPRVSETIEWAYEFSKPVYRIRHAFAHHVWGECSALPDILLLADPKDRLIGQAALSQLLGNLASEEEARVLMRIATGDGGSRLSTADARAIFEMAAARQNNHSKVEAFSMTFGNPLDIRAPAAEVWTAVDFRNAAIAANFVLKHVVGRLQTVSQWLNGLRTEDELEPLPTKPEKKRKR